MLLNSKFRGTCTTCKTPYEVGERISWVKGVFGAKHARCSEEGAAVQKAVEASRATDANVHVPCPEGLSFLPYQRAGIAFALARRNTLIADEMGLGKTVQAIGVMNSLPEAKRILVVCPASLKGNWAAEVKKWDTCGREVCVFPALPTNMVGVTIVNYDMLKKVEPHNWDLLILDEAHYAKNAAAKRTQLVRAHAKQARRILAMTGTPLDKPKEIWTLLDMLDPTSWAAKNPKYSEKNFQARYCAGHLQYIPTRAGGKTVWNADGASNLDELQERLRSTIMVRRLKKDVLKELPDKTRQIVSLGACRDSGYGDDVTFENYDEQAAALRAGAKIGFEDISRVRHEEALKKLPLAIDFIKEALDGSDHKIVVFAHHRDVIEELGVALAGYGALTIYGGTDKEDRKPLVDAFQENANIRVMIGSIGAMGVGLTLTASSHVIFVELDWTTKNMNQAEDRCHRIGQKDNVFVQHLVLDGSIDSKIVKILIKKQAVGNRALDEVAVYADAPPVREEIAFTSCTCLPGNGPHASWCDFAGTTPGAASATPAAASATPAAASATPVKAPKLTAEEIEAIHEALRTLAGSCDGARTRDKAGFNRFDAAFGRSLAERPTLTEKQALAARAMLKKYRRQIGDV